jgi:hypothetical protein
MTVQSATKRQGEDGVTIYTAKCKSIWHNDESTWMFYFKDDELIAICDYLPANKLWAIKYR